MNRQELVEILATQTQQSQKSVNRLLGALIDTIQTAVANGEKVTLSGFGTFRPRLQKARLGRNVRTGEQIHIPEAIRPSFSAGAHFRRIVAQSESERRSAP